MLAQANSFHIPLVDKSVHCCVTSPPYWSLRDYNLPPTVWGGRAGCKHEWGKIGKVHSGGKQRDEQGGQRVGRDFSAQNAVRDRSTGQFCQRCGAWLGCLGLESTPELYIEHLVTIFREVWRVLRPDGTLWLNLGDSYANDGKWGGTTSGKHVRSLHGKPVGRLKRTTGLKSKDLCGIPWRVALALQADGWWLRSEITWCKKAPMPESVRDRPTSATEKVFLLTRQPRYFYDSEAVRVASSGKHRGSKFTAGKTAKPGMGQAERQEREGRNLWNYWLLGPEPYPFAHFATFPTALVRPMLLAGTSARGVCAKCGKPWERVTEREFVPQRDVSAEKGVRGHDGTKKQPFDSWDGFPRGSTHIVTIGWQPACDCDADTPTPSVVLDPFCGSGTVGQVCRKLSAMGHPLQFIGLDLNGDYLRDLALPRAEGKTATTTLETLPLFGGPQLRQLRLETK